MNTKLPKLNEEGRFRGLLGAPTATLSVGSGPISIYPVSGRWANEILPKGKKAPPAVAAADGKGVKTDPSENGKVPTRERF